MVGIGEEVVCIISETCSCFFVPQIFADVRRYIQFDFAKNNKMKAFTRKQYCAPDKMQLTEIEKPVVQDGFVLVKVLANSANPADWHICRGAPFFSRFVLGLFKPKNPIVGVDFSGVVEAVGQQVHNIKPGDAVFGESLDGGAFAEYILIPESACAHIPTGIAPEIMAALPVAALTAYQALLTHGKLQSGEQVCINGASGGVGHFAVQIAKAYGAHVTGICSQNNADFVKSLGADVVITYDTTDIHQYKGSFDLVIDTHGNLNLSDYMRMGKRGVMTGFTTMGHMMRVLIMRMMKGYPLAQFTAAANTQDLNTLAELVASGKIAPHIQKTYSYTEIPAAVAGLEAMRTRGKVVMRWDI